MSRFRHTSPICPVFAIATLFSLLISSAAVVYRYAAVAYRFQDDKPIMIANYFEPTLAPDVKRGTKLAEARHAAAVISSSERLCRDLTVETIHPGMREHDKLLSELLSAAWDAGVDGMLKLTTAVYRCCGTGTRGHFRGHWFGAAALLAHPTAVSDPFGALLATFNATGDTFTWGAFHGVLKGHFLASLIAGRATYANLLSPKWFKSLAITQPNKWPLVSRKVAHERLENARTFMANATYVQTVAWLKTLAIVVKEAEGIFRPSVQGNLVRYISRKTRYYPNQVKTVPY